MSNDAASLFTLHHVGIIVGGIEAAMDAYATNFGSSFSEFEVNESNSSFSGSSSNFRLRFGIGHLGMTMIELIEPLSGTTIYSDFLAQHGPGLYHVGYCVTDLASASTQLETRGYRCLMKGTIHKLADFNYYEAPDLACVIEPLQLSIDLSAFLLKNAKLYTGKST